MHSAGGRRRLHSFASGTAQTHGYRCSPTAAQGPSASFWQRTPRARIPASRRPRPARQARSPPPPGAVRNSSRLLCTTPLYNDNRTGSHAQTQFWLPLLPIPRGPAARLASHHRCRAGGTKAARPGLRAAPPGRTHLLKSKGMVLAGAGQAAGPAAPGPGSRLAAAGRRARK